MHCHRPILFAAALAACLMSDVGRAAPTPVDMSVSLETSEGSTLIDSLTTHGPVTLDPNSSAVLDPFEPDYGAPIDVSYTVDTVGDQRTVRFTFASQGDALVTPGAVADVIPPPDGGRWALFFGFKDFNDPEFDRTRPAFNTDTLSNEDGILLQFSVGGSNLADGLGFGDAVPPTDPGFAFGQFAGATTFERTVTYTIPEPGTLSLLAVGSTLALRRRRTTAGCVCH